MDNLPSHPAAAAGGNNANLILQLPRAAISVDTRSAPDAVAVSPPPVHQLRKLNIDLRLLFLNQNQKP